MIKLYIHDGSRSVAIVAYSMFFTGIRKTPVAISSPVAVAVRAGYIAIAQTTMKEWGYFKYTSNLLQFVI